jgi:N-acetyl-beta-hexosaminidase
MLGAQAQLWTEYMPDTRHVEYMAFPRLCALAEATWTPAPAKDYGDFVRRLATHLKRLSILDVNYRTLDGSCRNSPVGGQGPEASVLAGRRTRAAGHQTSWVGLMPSSVSIRA